MADTFYKFDKRERKKNTQKAEIISNLAHFLTEETENDITSVNVTKAEREIDFSFGGNDYTIALIQHRTPKK